MTGSQKSEQINDLVQAILADVPEVLGIYLFGSRSSGTQHAGSDIDIAILTQPTFVETKIWELSQKLASRVSTDIDIVDLKQASAVMRMQIISEGQRLYCSDENACAVFEDFVFSDYARLNEERAAILEDIRERSSVYGWRPYTLVAFITLYRGDSNASCRE